MLNFFDIPRYYSNFIGTKGETTEQSVYLIMALVCNL